MDKQFQIGLKLWSTNTTSYYEDAKRLYNDGWFDYIELYVIPDTLDAITKWKQADIPFTIHAPHFFHGFNLADKSKKKINGNIYSQIRKYADELSSDFIIFHGGIDGDIEETACQLNDLDEPRALIENLPYRALQNNKGGRFCRGYNIKEIDYVINETQCGFCLDFGHAACSANSQKTETYDYMFEFAKLNPKMYHLTDVDNIKSEYDSHAHIGKGQLNIDDILNKISSNSKVTIETIKGNKDNLNDFIEDIKWLRNSK